MNRLMPCKICFLSLLSDLSDPSNDVARRILSGDDYPRPDVAVPCHQSQTSNIDLLVELFIHKVMCDYARYSPGSAPGDRRVGAMDVDDSHGRLRVATKMFPCQGSPDLCKRP